MNEKVKILVGELDTQRKINQDNEIRVKELEEFVNVLIDEN